MTPSSGYKTEGGMPDCIGCFLLAILIGVLFKLSSIDYFAFWFNKLERWIGSASIRYLFETYTYCWFGGLFKLLSLWVLLPGA